LSRTTCCTRHQVSHVSSPSTKNARASPCLNRPSSGPTVSHGRGRPACRYPPGSTSLARQEGQILMAKNDSDNLRYHRRELLVGAAYLTLGLSKAHATAIVDHLPWTPNAGNPPTTALPGPWMFFTGDEGRAIEALADCIIPPDPQTAGGKDSGSAMFI